MIGIRRIHLLAVGLFLTASLPLSAQVQSPDQRKCITAMNDAAAKVASTQLLVATKCLRDAAKGKLPVGQTAVQCLTADDKGKVAKVAALTAAKDGIKCTTAVPSFGYSGEPALTAAAVAGALGTFESLYGTDLDAAVIDADVDKGGAKCQAAVAKGVSKVLAAMLGEFRACKKGGVKDGTIASATDLALCFDAIDTDAKGKVAKALAKLEAKRASACAATAQASAVPGSCAGAVDLGACLASVARCRTCETFNAADLLERNCDLFDDTLANASCSAPTICIDDDHDMYGSGCGLGPDCDDTDPNVNPAAAEICNNIDDDCNTLVDEFPVDVGTSCGVSNVAPCAFGTNQCHGGMLMCSGSVDPKTETCNGVDDDCDGSVDLAGASQPADSVGSCDAQPAPPMGATSPCMPGAKACVAGVVSCQGATGPSSSLDSCGIDANCDGQLTNQPNLQTDVQNCGSCTNNCYSGAVHSRWTCATGSCQFGGCDAGYYDLDANQTCEYACSFISAQESCNGIDDNCNGLIDEGIVAPSPAQVCGVSPGATAPGCTSGVTVSCVAGGWQCTFPAGVCNGPGGCGATAELCDAIDNNCNGAVDEAGVCGGCVSSPEVCDGCDNDCDGVADNGVTGTVACGVAFPPNCAGVLTCKPAQAVGTPGGCAPGGGYNPCSNSPQVETCDGIDNNCNGIVDDGFFSSSQCTPVGFPPGLVYGGTSQCQRGQTQCGGGTTICVGGTGPSAEVCDGIDNNCDGSVDNGAAGVGQACGLTQAPCSAGVIACVGGALVCQGGVGPQPEVCDGVDNNCNGSIDELPLADAPAAGQAGCWADTGAACGHSGLSWSFPAGATCSGNGVLTQPCNHGSLVCTGGAWSCQMATGPTAEACDGIDNDCNGAIDDGGSLCGGDLSCQNGLCRP